MTILVQIINKLFITVIAFIGSTLFVFAQNKPGIPSMDFKQTVTYNRGVETHLIETCTVQRSGNAKCVLEVTSNLAELKCKVIQHYWDRDGIISISLTRLSQKPNYNPKLMANDVSSPQKMSGIKLSEALKQEGIPLPNLKKFPEYNSYAVVKFKQRLSFHTVSELGSNRAIEMVVYKSRHSESLALWLQIHVLIDNRLVSSNPATCMRQATGRDWYNNFNNEYSLLKSTVSVHTIENQ